MAAVGRMIGLPALGDEGDQCPAGLRARIELEALAIKTRAERDVERDELRDRVGRLERRVDELAEALRQRSEFIASLGALLTALGSEAGRFGNDSL